MRVKIRDLKIDGKFRPGLDFLAEYIQELNDDVELAKRTNNLSVDDYKQRLTDNQNSIKKALDFSTDPKTGKLHKNDLFAVMSLVNDNPNQFQYLNEIINIINKKKPNPLEGISPIIPTLIKLNTKPQTDAFINILNALPKGKKLNQKELSLIQSGLSKIDTTHPQALGRCIKAMIESNIPLTPSFLPSLRESKLDNLCGNKDRTPEELVAISHILKNLSENKELDESIFDDIVKNAPKLSGKGSLLADICNEIRAMKLSVADNLEVIMNAKPPIAESQLEDMKSILEQVNKIRTKYNLRYTQDDLDIILNNATKLTGKAPALGRCLEGMAASRIEFLVSDPDRLDALLKLDSSKLDAVADIIDSLKAQSPDDKYYLDPDIFEDVITRKFSATEGKAIANAFKAMRGAGISLEGHRQEVMKRGVEELQVLEIIFKQLRKKPGQSSENLLQELDKNAINALVKDAGKIGQKDLEYLENLNWNNLNWPEIHGIARNAGFLADDPILYLLNEDDKDVAKRLIKEKILRNYATEIGQCINNMIKNNISPAHTFNLGGFLQDNLHRILGLKRSELQSVNTIMDGLKNALEEGENIDQDTFDYLVTKASDGKSNLDSLITNTDYTKAQYISKIFEAMKTAGIPLKGNFLEDKLSRNNAQVVMDLGNEELIHLNTILDGKPKPEKGPNKDKPLDKDSFKALISKLKNVESVDHAISLGRCINTMRENGISMTQLVGENNLERLFELKAKQLETVDELFKSLAKEEGALNETIFTHILDQMLDPAKPEPTDPEELEAYNKKVDTRDDFINKLGDITEAFKAMKDAGIDLKGNRHDVIKMSQTELQTLKIVLDELKGQTLKPNDFKALRNNIANLAKADIDALKKEKQDLKVKHDIKMEPVINDDDEIQKIVETYAKALGKCISLMGNNDISLTRTLKDNLSPLLTLSTAELKQANELFRSLGDGRFNISLEEEKYPLDEKSFNYVLNRMQTKDQAKKEAFMQKAPDIVAAFDKLNENKINLRGIRHNIMDMDGVNLQTFNTVLDQFKPPSGLLDKGELNENEVKELIDNIPNLAKKELEILKQKENKELADLREKVDIVKGYAQALGKCIKLIGENKGIPLTPSQNIAGLRQSNLSRLLELDTNQLNKAAELFDALASGPDKVASLDKGPFDEKAFKYVLDRMSDPDPKKAEKFTAKVSDITAAFGAMTKAKIDFRGHREAILDMPKEDLQTLTDVLDQLPQSKGENGLKPDEFKALRNNISKLRTAAIKQHPDYKSKPDTEKEDFINYYPNFAKQLGICINFAQQNKLQLTQPIGTSRLDRFLELNLDELTTVNKILTHVVGSKEKAGEVIDKDYDDVFDYIVKNAHDFNKPISSQEESTIQTKGDVIAQAFKDMCDAGITLKGHRRAIMDKDPKDITNLAKIVQQVVKPIPDTTPVKIDNNTFNFLRKNIGELKDSAPESIDKLANCIKILTKNKIGIATSLPFMDDKITKLMKLDKAQFTEVEKVLDRLESKQDLDAKTFDNLMDIKDLTTKAKYTNSKGVAVNLTKADLLVEAFKNISKITGGSVEGHRKRLMDLTAQQLATFNENINDKFAKKEDIDFKTEALKAKGKERNILEKIEYAFTPTSKM